MERLSGWILKRKTGIQEWRTADIVLIAMMNEQT